MVFLSLCLSVLVLLGSPQSIRGRPNISRVILCQMDGMGWPSQVNVLLRAPSVLITLFIGSTKKDSSKGVLWYIGFHFEYCKNWECPLGHKGWLAVAKLKASTLMCLRPAQLTEHPRSNFNPELFPHCAFPHFLSILATPGRYNLCNPDVSQRQNSSGLVWGYVLK